MKHCCSSRRGFLKSSAAAGLTLSAPTLFGVPQIARAARADILEQADFQLPDRLPQVINVFLYGGPSELAGNLTNIDRINATSQNPYPDALLRTLDQEGQITANGFWRNAGGLEMEQMLSAGHMSVYRTINRLKDDTRAHRPSVFSSQKGMCRSKMTDGQTLHGFVVRRFHGLWSLPLC